MPTLSVEQVVSGTALGLDYGLSDLLVLDYGGQNMLFALSRSEGRLIALDISTGGTLSVLEEMTLSGTFAAGSDPELSAIETAAGALRLAVAGLPVTTGQAVGLDPDLTLGGQVALPGASILVAPRWFDFGAAEGVVTGRLNAGGIDLLVDTGSGLSLVASLTDTADRYLAGVSDAVAFGIDGRFFLATTSAAEDGVNLAEVSATGLIQRSAMGAAEGLPINTPTNIDVIQRLGETLLVIGSSDSSSLSVSWVGPGGLLNIADHVLDSPLTRFQGFTSLETVVHQDFAFVAAGGGDGGISLFTVLPGGRLVHQASLADDASTTLYRVSDIEATVTGTRLDLLVTSAWEAGITRIGYDLSTLGAVLIAPQLGGAVSGTALDDQVIGSAMDDTLSGAAGDDILLDGAGEDLLIGGQGADLFVFHPDGQRDEISDFERAVDRLDLSAFDFLYDVSQLSVAPTSDGALLSFGGETILIRASDGSPLNAGDLSNTSILNLDRPPLLPVSQVLQGGSQNDTLNGAAGNDTISGADGDDVLTGQGGNDEIAGGAGNDLLDGGAGQDIISGDAGDDTLVGGLGDDLLTGGAGGDLIYGDEFDWLLA